MGGDACDGFIKGHVAFGTLAVVEQAVLAALPLGKVGPATHALGMGNVVDRVGTVRCAGLLNGLDLDTGRDGGVAAGHIGRADLGGIVAGEDTLVLELRGGGEGGQSQEAQGKE